MEITIRHSNGDGTKTVSTPTDYTGLAFLAADCNGGTLTAYRNGTEINTLVLPIRKQDETLKNFYNRISSYPAVCEFWNSICFIIR